MYFKKIVIKFGGNALNETTAKAFCSVLSQLPELGYRPIVVHGGGPQIDALLTRLKIVSHFVGGLRYTDEQTLTVAEMVLCGQVGKMLVRHLAANNVQAVGISGQDGKTLIAEKLSLDDQGNPIDLGFVGQITEVNSQLLNQLTEGGFIPVLAPLAYGRDGKTYNINADFAAAAIAKAVCAKHFIMMTNIQGLLNAKQQLIHSVRSADIQALIAEKTIQGGMIPKTLSAIETLTHTGEVNIIDGRDPKHLLTLLSGGKVGTRIVR